MSIWKNALAAWTGAQTLGHIAAGAVMGCVIMFFVLRGCGGDKNRTVWIAAKSDTVRVYDTIPVISPKPTVRRDSFYYELRTPSGASFGAYSETPVELRDVVLGYPVIRDTTYRDTCVEASSALPLGFETQAVVGLSAFGTRAVSVGLAPTLTLGRLSIAAEPNIMVTFDSLPLKVKPYFWIKVGLKL